MAATRFQVSRNKKKAIMKQQLRDIENILANDQPGEETARIKTEALIQDFDTYEAYELLQLDCELLSERMQVISHSKKCPPDMVSCVSTIIWASAVVDVPELATIRKQFRSKYGKKFVSDAMNNVGGVINDSVQAKLSAQPPSAELVQTYLEKIASGRNLDWKPKASTVSIVTSKATEYDFLQPTPAAPSALTSNMDAVEEEDIYVPARTVRARTPPSSSFGVVKDEIHNSSLQSSVMSSTTTQSKSIPVLTSHASPNVPLMDEYEHDIYICPDAVSQTSPVGVVGFDGHQSKHDIGDESYGEDQQSDCTEAKCTGEESRGSAHGDDVFDDWAAMFKALDNGQ
eukprot:CAMPEP_0183724418 /NCGR_PEP_ID=MMETSP0737-20130205/17918_1 /TAXON_ID=385413 /ORGANISM="Thalassiosira miniscula, Strain CCMP1093" /LENGTH=342 /DNA_ID=CAMNT_0025955003 /DNA_START=336 /DNA_END=1364 /DNA_ORIENTATION=+